MTDRNAGAAFAQATGFCGNVHDLASEGDDVLASIGKRGDGLSARLIRDYVRRGILARPERQGKEAIYRFQHLVQLVAARILVGEGWPLAKVRDYVSNAKQQELLNLAKPNRRGPRLSELRAELSVHMRQIEGGFRLPETHALSSISLAEDLHLLIGSARLKALTTDEAEAIGRALTASLIETAPRKGKP